MLPAVLFTSVPLSHTLLPRNCADGVRPSPLVMLVPSVSPVQAVAWPSATSDATFEMFPPVTLTEVAGTSTYPRVYEDAGAPPTPLRLTRVAPAVGVPVTTA